MNKQKKRYEGIVVPAVTPLTKDYKLDVGAVEKMFSNFYKNDAAPFILGTTGEATSLSFSLKKDYISKASSLKKNGTTLYAGISSNCLEEAITLAHLCFDNGIDVVAATLPSYYQLTNAQMETWFEQLAEGVKGPLIIYNIPATTHMSIPLDLIDRLSHHPNIVGTKDSERSDERLQQSLDLWKDRADFSHFLGWAARSATALLNGSDGLIPSTGNLYPAVYKQLADAAHNLNNEEANRLQALSDTLGDVYQKEKTLGESLWQLKVLMQQEGLCQSYVMPPLQPLTTEQNLIDQLNQIKQNSPIALT